MVGVMVNLTNQTTLTSLIDKDIKEVVRGVAEGVSKGVVILPDKDNSYHLIPTSQIEKIKIKEVKGFENE